MQREKVRQESGVLLHRGQIDSSLADSMHFKQLGSEMASATVTFA